MPIALKSDQVWKALERELFAVLATVSPKGEPRTAGIVYKVRNKKLYIAMGFSSVKAKNAQQNPHVSLTVTANKRIPFLPWIKIPAATITFQGVAKVHPANAVDPGLQKLLLGGLKVDEKALSDLCFIEVTPEGNFVTYGVGVSLMTMRDPDAARGRAPV